LGQRRIGDDREVGTDASEAIESPGQVSRRDEDGEFLADVKALMVGAQAMQGYDDGVAAKVTEVVLDGLRPVRRSHLGGHGLEQPESYAADVRRAVVLAR
jgi:hypothetical protein